MIAADEVRGEVVFGLPGVRVPIGESTVGAIGELRHPGRESCNGGEGDGVEDLVVVLREEGGSVKDRTPVQSQCPEPFGVRETK